MGINKAVALVGFNTHFLEHVVVIVNHYSASISNLFCSTPDSPMNIYRTDFESLRLLQKQPGMSLSWIDMPDMFPQYVRGQP
jgi:hypothetical protein